MWPYGDNYIEDMKYISSASYIPWELLKGKTILVTGATGLIGFNLINGLLYADREKKLNLTVLALVRNLERAKDRFQGLSEDGHLRFIVGDVRKIPEIEQPIDYIVHGASQTASKAFIQEPVETILTAVYGTENMLKLAKNKKPKGFVYLSSMEVYGYPEKGHKVTEDEIGALSPLDVRNSYPLSKQLCESLCCAYAREYNVPTRILRLTQTFGPGVNYNDNRIFAELARCVLEKRDIVLKTKGETERSYLYIADAVTAILAVLLRGKDGWAYNAANEDTYCSIAEMAYKVAEMGGVNVNFEIQDIKTEGFPKTLYMDMDTTILRNLGWTWGGNILDIYIKMVQWIVDSNGK